MPAIKFNLQENAESFLKEAVTRAVRADDDLSEWKFAVLSLVQSIELSLKEKLRRTHPLFVYSNIDRPVHTVSLTLAISRLESVASIPLEKTDLDAISLAQSIRNSITHTEFEMDIGSTKSIFSRLVAFTLHFHEKFLDENVKRKIPKDAWTRFLDIEGYAKDLHEKAIDRIGEIRTNNSWIITCIRCWHNTFLDSKDTSECFLCGYQDQTTVCQKCGTGLFESEGHQVDYGLWYSWSEAEQRRVPGVWKPYHCDECYQRYLELLEKGMVEEFIHGHS